MKSLTTLDLGGGQITGVSYNSQAPLARQLDALQLPLNEKTTRASLFEALRGARVSIHGRGATTTATTGRILSFERRTRDRVEIDQLVLWSEVFEVADSVLVKNHALDRQPCRSRWFHLRDHRRGHRQTHHYYHAEGARLSSHGR